MMLFKRGLISNTIHQQLTEKKTRDLATSFDEAKAVKQDQTYSESDFASQTTFS